MSYCTPCPPCDSEFPLLCEPLETTANGKRLVVEDSAACQKTIQTPVAQQVLKTDGAGNLTWTNGANNTVLGKDSTGKVEFVPSVNNILQAGPVDLGSQTLTTTGAITSSGNITSGNTVTCKLLGVTNTSGVAAIEVGGVGDAYIDLKVPNPDDNDIRIGTTGSGGYISTSGNGNIIIDPGTGSVGIATGTPNARLSVIKGANLFGSAEFVGSTETSFFHNSVDEHTYIRGGKTTSNVYLNDTSTGLTYVGSGGLVVNGTIFATGNSSKIGYTSGGSVTQGAGSKTNSVTLNRPTGQIITDNAALAANTNVIFNLINSVIENNDIVVVSHVTGGTPGSYNFAVTPGGGSANIVIRNLTGGSLSEALVLRFIVFKSAIA